MPSLGGGNMDIRSIVGSIVNFAKSKSTHAATAPCDGFVLKMHYRWTFFVFIAGFFSVWYNWYHRDIITCVSHFNADTQVRLDYINVCLSYPYIEQEDESRRYLLFYRWIHWTFFLLAGVYYIPRKVSKSIENPKAKKLIEELAHNSSRYDAVEAQVVDHTSKYILFNLQTHNGLYYKFVCLNFLALAIDAFTLLFLDFVLQGRFLKYGFKAYPFERDPMLFSDYMSVMFPPFASCELRKANQLTAHREEKLGCHLTFMELYEKLFLFLWLWIIFLMIVTTLYIVFALLMLVPGFRLFLLRTSKPIHNPQRVASIIAAVSKNCKIGDVYLLYRIKQHLSHARFHELLLKLSSPELCQTKLPQTTDPTEYEKYRHAGGKQPQPESLRIRKPTQAQQPQQPQQPHDPPINPEYLQHLLSNTSMTKKPTHNPQEAQQRTPLLNRNTSILIE